MNDFIVLDEVTYGVSIAHLQDRRSPKRFLCGKRVAQLWRYTPGGTVVPEQALPMNVCPGCSAKFHAYREWIQNSTRK